MRIIIDASVALKWVFDEPESDHAIALRDDQLIAPVLWLIEAANAVWRRVRLGDITPEQASVRLTELQNAPIASLPVESYLDAALQFAIELSHPVYDCLYLAVAIQHQTHVVTADRRFAALADRRPNLARLVRLLGA